MSALDHFKSLPGLNEWLIVMTAITFIILTWASLAAIRTSFIRYPPMRGREYNEVVRGRRAWATAAVLATTAIWCLHRVDVLWWTERAVNDRAIIIEFMRAGAAVWLAVAWFIPTNREHV